MNDNKSAAFQQAANDFYLRGWVPLALGLDAQGFPKRPLAPAWTSIPHTAQAVRAQPWGQAKGIGLLLGPPSGNLSCIDLDDVDLADEAYRITTEQGIQTRIVWTIRKRIHLYFKEYWPSKSVSFPVTWRGKTIRIELKAEGTQVATFPTPGYVMALDAPPLAVPSLAIVWMGLASKLGAVTQTNGGGKAGYPQPWQPKVEKGERNKAIYIEAHKLREAGMPLDMALDIMQARVEQHYIQGGMTWQEVKATVQSAYRKGTASGRTAKVVRWRHGKPILPTQEVML